jgi:hypothetical protein
MLTLESLCPRETERKDGRPRRAYSIPPYLREKFLEVIDTDGVTCIMVYVTKDGQVRRDVEQVQDELCEDDVFCDDDEGVMINDVMQPLRRKRAREGSDNGNKSKRLKTDDKVESDNESEDTSEPSSSSYSEYEYESECESESDSESSDNESSELEEGELKEEAV